MPSAQGADVSASQADNQKGMFFLRKIIALIFSALFVFSLDVPVTAS